MHLLWFRRDLRLTDNEIVTLATADGAVVLPLFIIDPWFYTWADVGKGRVISNSQVAIRNSQLKEPHN